MPVFVKAGAIVPLAPATNTPKEYFDLKKQRQFVVYPNGNSCFTAYEDDGFSAKYQQGDYAQTTISSHLLGSDLTIQIAKTKGTYTSFDPEKTTEIDIRTKKAPKAVKTMVGNQEISLNEVNSIAEFRSQENCYFFDQNYLVNPYLKEFSTNLKQTFLRIKLGQTNTSQNEITVKIAGIDTSATPVNSLPAEDDSLTTPTNLVQDDEKTTADSITVSWQPVADCDSYQLKIDNLLYTNIKKASYTLSSLKSESEHTFEVRAVKDLKASSWGTRISCQTKKADKKEQK